MSPEGYQQVCEEWSVGRHSGYVCVDGGGWGVALPSLVIDGYVDGAQRRRRAAGQRGGVSGAVMVGWGWKWRSKCTEISSLHWRRSGRGRGGSLDVGC